MLMFAVTKEDANGLYQKNKMVMELSCPNPKVWKFMS